MRNHLCILSYSVVSDLCDPVDCSPPGSSLRGIVPVSPSKNTGVGYYFFLQGIFLPRGQTCISCISCIAGGFFTTERLGKSLVTVISGV